MRVVKLWEWNHTQSLTPLYIYYVTTQTKNFDQLKSLRSRVFKWDSFATEKKWQFIKNEQPVSIICPKKELILINTDTSVIMKVICNFMLRYC